MMRLDPFYLITGHVNRLERLVPLGVRLVQLRIKDLPEAELRRQIARARDICAVHGATLVVNDHWRLALDLNCGAVHLGQEDMDRADLPALRRHGIRFGLSTHDEAELDRALAERPDYVALGPVWPTLLKKMKWGPQGLDRVRRWKTACGDTPLVGIGGVTPERLPGLFAAGADSAAVVTDIQQAPSPEARCLEWIEANAGARAMTAAAPLSARYERQIRLPEIGTQGQQRLARARVLVAGAGGLGATLLPQLAGAGLGEIALYDPDTVALGNLHRQTLFRMQDIGRPKAQVAAEALAGLNPECRIVPVVAALDPASARTAMAGVDLVIDAADSFATSYALSDLCMAAGLPLISASVLGRSGYVGGFSGGAPSLRALFPDLPPRMGSCASDGVMGPAVATMAAIQAQMALSVLLDLAPSPLGQMLSVDLAGWRVSGFRFDDAPEPPAALPAVIAQSQLVAGDMVIELRSTQERPTPGAAQARRLAPEAVPGLHPPPEQRVVFICSSGLRAWHAARSLAERGHERLAIMADPD